MAFFIHLALALGIFYVGKFSLDFLRLILPSKGFELELKFGFSFVGSLLWLFQLSNATFHDGALQFFGFFHHCGKQVAFACSSGAQRRQQAHHTCSVMQFYSRKSWCLVLGVLCPDRACENHEGINKPVHSVASSLFHYCSAHFTTTRTEPLPVTRNTSLW